MYAIDKKLEALAQRLQEPETRQIARKSPLFGGADVSFVPRKPAPREGLV
ncbi:MAG: hypothetical protein ACXIT9_11860 [Nitritalea sp.]